MICLQDEVVARDEAIRREYNELDTLWFMAGSLFQVFLDLPSIFPSRIGYFVNLFYFSQLLLFCSNILLTYLLRLFRLKYSSRLLLQYSLVLFICR
jgi:hypothetical protein